MTLSTWPNLRAFVEFVTNATACWTDKGLLFSVFALGQGWSLRTSRWGLCRNIKWFEGREESLKKVSSCLHLVLSHGQLPRCQPLPGPGLGLGSAGESPVHPSQGCPESFFQKERRDCPLLSKPPELPTPSLVHTPASPGKADGLIWSFRHPWRAELIADSWWTYDNQVSFRPLKLAWGCLRGNCIWGVGSTQRWWRQREPWLKPLRIGCDPHQGWQGVSSDSVLVARARVWVDFMEHPPEGWL